MTDSPRAPRTAVVTLHVHAPGWGQAEPERLRRLQSATHHSLQRLAHRLIQQPTTQIAAALAELARHTGGHLADEDLPMAAVALHRGEHVAVRLINPTTPCTTWHPTRPA